MSGVKPRWVKRKRQLSRVESMLAAKSQRAASGESSSSTSVQQPDQLFEEQSSAVSVGEQSTLEESFLLPRVYSSDEETDSDTESDFNETSAKEIYRDWMSSQCKSDVQMMAVVLMDTFRERFGMTDVGAASEAGIVVGFNEKTVRTWRNDFYANRGEFSESYQGKHARAFVLDDGSANQQHSFGYISMLTQKGNQQ